MRITVTIDKTFSNVAAFAAFAASVQALEGFDDEEPADDFSTPKLVDGVEITPTPPRADVNAARFIPGEKNNLGMDASTPPAERKPRGRRPAVAAPVEPVKVDPPAEAPAPVAASTPAPAAPPAPPLSAPAKVETPAAAAPAVQAPAAESAPTMAHLQGAFQRFCKAYGSDERAGKIANLLKNVGVTALSQLDPTKAGDAIAAIDATLMMDGKV